LTACGKWQGSIFPRFASLLKAEQVSTCTNKFDKASLYDFLWKWPAWDMVGISTFSFKIACL